VPYDVVITAGHRRACLCTASAREATFAGFLLSSDDAGDGQPPAVHFTDWSSSLAGNDLGLDTGVSIQIFFVKRRMRRSGREDQLGEQLHVWKSVRTWLLTPAPVATNAAWGDAVVIYAVCPPASRELVRAMGLQRRHLVAFSMAWARALKAHRPQF